MSAPFARLVACALVVACGSVAIPLGSQECARYDEPCPSTCTQQKSSTFDRARGCVRADVAFCVREPYGRTPLAQCCVREHDGAMFIFSSAPACPAMPYYGGWHKCSAEESTLFMGAKTCE